jgi:short-subunit dehydrogenase
MKLASKLPDGERNGLYGMEKALLQNPSGQQVVVMVVDCKSVTTDMDTEEQQATARIKRAEWITDDLETAQRLFENAVAKRTGQTVLPIEQANEIDRVFANIIDPNTGEILGGADDE